MSATRPVADRVDRLRWADIAAGLDDVGVGPTGSVLTVGECRSLVDVYGDDSRFRSTIDMARHRFGEGQYRYFDHPLPDVVTELRAAFWPHLLPIARTWAERRGQPAPWPDRLEDWLDRCHDAGQTRPTPLMLRYGPGDFHRRQPGRHRAGPYSIDTDISSSRLRTAIARRMSVHVELSSPASFAGPTRVAPVLVITSLAAIGPQ